MKLFGTSKVVENELSIGGVKVTELRENFQTPLYVMDQDLIEENISIFRDNFVSSKFDTEVVYASKAFLCTAMAQLVNRNNISMDVVSGGELYTAIKAKFPMEKLYFHGNNKTIDELEFAVESNIGTIIIDNPLELNRLEKICVEKNQKINVLLRVNPGIDAHTHEYIQTSKFSSKFGESIFDEKIYDIIKDIMARKNINLLGFHCHIGSQIFDEKPFFSAIDTMFKFAKDVETNTGLEVKMINLGGGFGIYYSEEDTPIPLKDFVVRMVKDLEVKKEEYGLNIEKINIEPGRSIVANSGTTLYTVGGVKDTYSGKKYIFIDGGMTDNIRTALYQAKYEGVIATKMKDELSLLATVAGKCCESGDVIIHDGNFANAEDGDIFAVSTTGAYNYSMSSNYNRIGRPAVVFVKDGKAKLVVKRETYEDLIKNDLILD
jgi:diaminopimelate decarboxylase